MKRFPLLIFLAFLIPFLKVQARQITGQVRDHTGHPLAYASVFVKGTSNGTTTNAEGFYRLTIDNDSCRIVFKYLGFKTEEVSIQAGNSELRIDIMLHPETYSLGEVVIKAGEDPAYPIMRAAISKRTYYLNQVEGFSCSVYIKGVQRLLQWPEKFLGNPVVVSAFIDTNTKIIYLSESVSNFHYKKPDKFFEVMVSSKVSGNSRGFSWNRASDMQFNFYENIIKTDVAPRGLISPLSSSAFFYYRFRHEGTFIENNLLIHKIAVIPKRKNDPVFSGYLFIQENSWRIHGADLLVTHEAQLQWIDTLQVKQVFIPVTDEIWMPAHQSFYFHFSILGFTGNGNFTGVFSDYKINPDFPPSFFSGKTMKVNEESNKKDSAYWNLIRPVPLTETEKRDYVFKDSLQDLRQSKPFLDSIDRVTNKLTPVKILLTGYEYRQRYRRLTFSFSSLMQNLQFNTVEGFNAGLSVRITKFTDTLQRRRMEINPFIQYNFSSENVYATLQTVWNYNRKKFSSVMLEGGRRSFQFNPDNPVNLFINTNYTLFDRRNYLKIYKADFVKLSWKSEIVNGIYTETGTQWSKRSPLANTTDFSFKNKDSRPFTSNNPLNPLAELPVFPEHDQLAAEVKFILKPGQEYIDRPYSKIITGQRFPTLSLTLSKSFSVSDSSPDFSSAEASVNHTFDAALMGNFEIEISGGQFFDVKRIYFPDFHHFNGNLTFFSDFKLRHFYLLDYYTLSTADRYAEVHAEHHFKGFLFNKIPGLRKLKLEEHTGLHLLHVPQREEYYELNFGVSKLGLIRFDFVMAFQKSKVIQRGFRIALAGIN
jgi:hypothetical protein